LRALQHVSRHFAGSDGLLLHPAATKERPKNLAAHETLDPSVFNQKRAFEKSRCFFYRAECEQPLVLRSIGNATWQAQSENIEHK